MVCIFSCVPPVLVSAFRCCPLCVGSKSDLDAELKLFLEPDPAISYFGSRYSGSISNSLLPKKKIGEEPMEK